MVSTFRSSYKLRNNLIFIPNIIKYYSLYPIINIILNLKLLNEQKIICLKTSANSN